MDALLLTTDAAATKEAIKSLTVAGFAVESTDSIVDALNKVRSGPYDLLVVPVADLGPGGIDFLRTVRLLRPEQPIAVIGPRQYVRSALDSVGAIQMQPFSWNALAEAAKRQLVLEPAEGGAYAGRLSSIFETVRTSLLREDYDAVFSVLLEHAADIVGAGRVRLFTLNRKGTALALKAKYPVNSPSSEEGIPLGQILAAKAGEKKGLLIFPDPQLADAELQLEMSVEGASSALGLPIFCNDQLRGVLTAYRTPPVLPFTLEDAGRLKGVMSWLSLSVEILGLAQEKQALAGELSQVNEQHAQTRREIEALNKMFQSQIMAFQQFEGKANSLMTSYQQVLPIIGQLAERRKSPSPGNIHHQKGQWITQLGKAVGIEDERIAELAFVYDIGVLSVPEGLMHKSFSELNEVEQGQFCEHVLLGEQQAEAMALPKEYVKAVRHHHEKYDGSGYPDGLARDEIPLLARILQVVDAIGSMVTPGFQRPAMSAEGALAELRRNAGRAFDPKLVEAFDALMGQARTQPPSETEVISTVSHELRSPLTYLVGYSELLATQKDLPAESLQRVQAIHSEALHMSRVVEEILEMTRLETGSMPLGREEVDLAYLINQVVQKAQVVNKGHTIVKQVPSTLPMIIGDPDRLQEVLDNLVDNAAKYSPQGGNITISARPLPGEIEINVADQGIGIPAAALDKVFGKFYRVDNAVTRSVRGTGLGLNLCQKIVEGHGGHIWLESQEGKGSTFYFTIPLPQAI